MLIHTPCLPETNIQSPVPITEISLQQQDELIQSALRCLKNRICYHSNPLKSTKDACDYVRLCLAREANEVFAAFFLDAKHRVLAFEKLFFGTINVTSVYPRVIVQRALANNAASVIFAHNHPSGQVEPSHADEELTDRLKRILEVIDVHVLDHFVVSVEGAFSFAELGLL